MSFVLCFFGGMLMGIALDRMGASWISIAAMCGGVALVAVGATS